MPDSGSVTLNGFGFAGEQVDPESGFVYLRNRSYDPTTSRFLTPDPLGALGSGVNLYAYVDNNPANVTDPTGLGGKGGLSGGGGAGFYDPGMEETAQEAANGVRGVIGKVARGIQRLFGGGAEDSAPPMDVNPETQQCLAPTSEIKPIRGASDEEGEGRFAEPTVPIMQILEDPEILQGKTPDDLLEMLGEVPSGWKIETLGQGSHEGQGFVLRQCTDEGNATGRMIRWHPGDGQHGPGAYWRVTSGEFGASERVPAGQWTP